MIVTLLLRVRDRCKRRLVSSFTDENTSLVAFVMEIRYLWANFFRADRGKQKKKNIGWKIHATDRLPARANWWQHVSTEGGHTLFHWIFPCLHLHWTLISPISRKECVGHLHLIHNYFLIEWLIKLKLNRLDNFFENSIQFSKKSLKCH